MFQGLPPIISVTDRAADRVKAIIAKSDKSISGLKIGVKKGGCAGMEYSMDYVEQAETGDDIVQTKDITLYVDKSAMMFLLGTEMDFETSTFSSGFVFKNPNQVSACGCGESVEIIPATPEQIEEYRQSS